MPRLSKIGAAALGAFGWTGLSSVSASYLVVAGGGGGGSNATSFNGGTGGGGAGGYKASTTSLNPLLSYTITVGAGGTGGIAGTPTSGNNGSNSVFSTITSTGGGGGGKSGASDTAGVAGGSGGGGGSSSATSIAGGAGTSGQGNTGGSSTSTGSTYGAGGGGGAGAVGSNGSGNSGGNGGAGSASSITGTSVTYAGGGGGGAYTPGTGGTGGSGGGGNGALTSGISGTANLGGGGGGGGDNGGAGQTSGGNGGSGVVIISYLGAQQFGGGVVTSSGGYTIHTFNTSGTLAPLSSLSASYLIVAGGGGGGAASGAGGGAGGMLTGSGLTIDTNSTYAITVGAGGTGGSSSASGVAGSNSLFSIYSTAAVGGGYGAGGAGNVNGGAGGSGGGGCNAGTGGSATSGQGNTGGNGFNDSNTGGGGGGAGAVGANGASGAGGAGGAGTASSISGTSTTYAGGGGGRSTSSGGAGGSGGGGAGAVGAANGTAGTANLGGGGGGAGGGYTGGAGGSGVVIISYAGATQSMAGGTVTISGGNVIHTFTSSGYLTPLKLVNNSLRFRSSASAYLNRTFATPTSGSTWTMSMWFKRGKLSASQTLFGVYNSGTNYFVAEFQSDDTFQTFDRPSGGATGQLVTTQVFRDPAAWYHIVLVWDTTQATSTNRQKLYINGVQVTSFSTQTNSSQSAVSRWNFASYNGCIGNDGNAGVYFDGYQTEVNFIDGQALTPNSFGTANSYGVWQPITYGGSYGTNGFYLPFTNTTSTTTLGYDFSPQGNNWTTNNISLTAGSTYDSMTDVPTLTSTTVANYCVLNPLSVLNSTASDGNLKGTLNAASVTTDIYGTMASGTTGKFYWETTYVSRSGNSALTTGGVRSDIFGAEPSGTGGFGYYSVGGQVFVNGSTVATYATYTTSDVIGIFLDLTNSQVSFYKQTSGTGSFVLQGTVSISSGYSWIPGYGNGTTSGNQVVTVNFGQQPFNNSSPPSGYVALNTYNI